MLDVTQVLVLVGSLLTFVYLRKLRGKANGLAKNESSHATTPSKQALQMPCPPQIPVIGHLHLLKDYADNPWEGFDAIRTQFGNLVSLQLGVHKMALASSSEMFKEILENQAEIFADRPSFARHHIVFGGDKENSLALCNWSDVHVERRRFCIRGIVPSNVSDRIKLLEDCIDSAVQTWLCNIQTNNLSQQQRQIVTKSGANNVLMMKTNRQDLLFLTGDVFLQFLCEKKYDHEMQEYAEFNKGCDFIFWDINHCYLIDFLPYLSSLGLCYSYLKTVKRISDMCRDFIDKNIFEPRMQVIKKLRQQQQETTTSRTSQIQDSTANNQTIVKDYLDSIICDYLDKNSIMSLADFKVGFADLLAGHAAVSNILLRCLGHLSLDTSIQELIFDEVKNIQRLKHLSGDDFKRETIKLSDRIALPTAKAVMHEALRIGASPLVPHVAIQDTIVNNYHVPKGTTILFNVYNLNLSPEFWHEPRKFNPRRFLKFDLETKTNKLSLPSNFNPFSVGLRTCLGRKMVESITVTAIANLCKNFVITSSDVELTQKLLAPLGTIALDPDAPCYHLNLQPR